MKAGTFYWYELATSDPEGAAAFYGTVVGWRFTPQPAAPEGMTYLIGWAGESPAAGIMSYRSDMPDPGVTRWWGSLLVDDVDATADAIAAAGGEIRHRPADTADIERSAAVVDPQGSGFLLSRPQGSGEMPPRHPI